MDTILFFKKREKGKNGRKGAPEKNKKHGANPCRGETLRMDKKNLGGEKEKNERKGNWYCWFGEHVDSSMHDGASGSTANVCFHLRLCIRYRK